MKLPPSPGRGRVGTAEAVLGGVTTAPAFAEASPPPGPLARTRPPPSMGRVNPPPPASSTRAMPPVETFTWRRPTTMVAPASGHLVEIATILEPRGPMGSHSWGFVTPATEETVVARLVS